MLALQSVVPQTQGPGLTVAPLPCGQAGPVKVHRQALDSGEEQELVEDVSVLKCRLPPLMLLLVS